MHPIAGIEAEDWGGWLKLYARGDFDADGYECLLVMRGGKANEGSYAGVSMFMLSRTTRTHASALCESWEARNFGQGVDSCA